MKSWECEVLLHKTTTSMGCLSLTTWHSKSDQDTMTQKVHHQFTGGLRAMFKTILFLRSICWDLLLQQCNSSIAVYLPAKWRSTGRISYKDNTEFAFQGCVLTRVHTPKPLLQTSAFEQTSITEHSNLMTKVLSHFLTFNLLVGVPSSA